MIAVDCTVLASVARNVLASEDRSLNSLLDFSPGATIWTLICFLVGLPLMWKFVYGPITRALEARDQKVEDSIKAAEVARQQAEAQVAAAKTELDKARAEAKRMVDEALARADRQAADALRAAEERAKAQLDKARDEIEAQKRHALQEIRAHVVELTIAATGRLLQHEVDDQVHRRMVQEFVAAAGDRNA
jgi:F-type H+-transporting ATPase subunit b